MPRTIVTNSPISEAVNRRFFMALDAIVTYKLTPSQDAFFIEHDLSAPRYREMRLQYGVAPTTGKQSRYKNIEIEAIYTLVAFYPVSANWLITGRGNMLTRKITAKNEA